MNDYWREKVEELQKENEALKQMNFNQITTTSDALHAQADLQAYANELKLDIRVLRREVDNLIEQRDTLITERSIRNKTLHETCEALHRVQGIQVEVQTQLRAEVERVSKIIDPRQAVRHSDVAYLKAENARLEERNRNQFSTIQALRKEAEAAAVRGKEMSESNELNRTLLTRLREAITVKGYRIVFGSDFSVKVEGNTANEALLKDNEEIRAAYNKIGGRIKVYKQALFNRGRTMTKLRLAMKDLQRQMKELRDSAIAAGFTVNEQFPSGDIWISK